MSYQVFYNYLENTTSREAFYEVLGVRHNGAGICITRYGKIGAVGQFKVDYSPGACNVASKASYGKQGRHYRKKRDVDQRFDSEKEMLTAISHACVNHGMVTKLHGFLSDPTATTPAYEVGDEDENDTPIKVKPLKAAAPKVEVVEAPKPAAWGQW